MSNEKALVVKAPELAHLRGAMVLIVTVTAVELAAVRERLTALPDGNLYKTSILSETYYIGVFGACTAVVVKCEMGTSGRDAALAVCTEALQVWRPRAAIMVGIAFGKDPERQQMCDVLVANHLIPYELAKLGRSYVARAAHPPVNALLLNRFVNATAWTFYRQGRSRVQVRIGPMLTGEKVVDNPRAKSKLFRLFPSAIGGEMEGAGLFAAADRRSTPWILVKAICDWGDGTKDDKFQRKAAAASASLVHYVLAEPGALDDLPIPAMPSETSPFLSPLSSVRLTPAPRVEVLGQPADQKHEAELAQDSRQLIAPRLEQTGSADVAHLAPAPDRRRERSSRLNLVLLTPKELDALRLIGTAPVPLPSEFLATLFPRLQWRSLLRALRKNGVVETNEPEPVVIARGAGRKLFDSAVTARYEQKWLRRLESLRDHTDTAVLLSLLHLRSKRYEEAVAALSDVAEGLEPGHTNAFYRNLLTHFMVPRFLRKLSTERRIHLLNAYGLCLSHDGEYAQSIDVFRQLLSASRATRHVWGLGQAYINSGVGHFHLGNLAKAKQCYRMAVRHAKRAKDRSLEGRALHNLGLIVSEEFPTKGAALVDRALKLKLASGDIAGVAGTLMGQGNLHSHAGRHAEALTRYGEAAALARDLDMRHLRGLALSNMASSYVDLSKPEKALPHYKEARRIAIEEGFQDVVRLTTQGEAVALSQLKQFRPAMTLFLQLAAIQQQQGSDLGLLRALHDAGVMAVRAADFREGERILKKALRLAQKQTDQQWIFRCHLALSEVTRGTTRPRAWERLQRAAVQVSRGGLHEAAARLWLAALDRAVQSNAESSKVDALGDAALRESARSRDQMHALEVYKRLYLWRRNRNEPSAALTHAQKMEQYAREERAPFERISAIDEQACCHQLIGNMRSAEQLHRKALSLAEKAGSREALASPLVNLAALLRNTGRLSESRDLLKRAEAVAAETDDIPLAAMIAGTMALVLADEGKPRSAKRLLTTWEKKTGRLEMWPEHVLALHRLANLAFTLEDLEGAETLYRRAISEAKLHADHTQADIAHNFVGLLAERMRGWLLTGQSQRADRAFERAKALTKQYELTQSYRDLLFTLGDTHWRMGPRHYAKGVRAYLAAYAQIPEVSIEESLKLNALDGARLVLHFHRIPQAQPLSALERLVRKSRDWLRREGHGKLTGGVEAFLCWPLDVGLQVAALVRGPHAPDATAVSELASSGFQGAVARLRNDAA